MEGNGHGNPNVSQRHRRGLPRATAATVHRTSSRPPQPYAQTTARGRCHALKGAL